MASNVSRSFPEMESPAPPPRGQLLLFMFALVIIYYLFIIYLFTDESYLFRMLGVLGDPTQGLPWLRHIFCENGADLQAITTWHPSLCASFCLCF